VVLETKEMTHGFNVNTNTSSLNAQRQLVNSGNNLDTADKPQILSSGFRIQQRS
jgi:flagellin-like hook-associated protein FlgL